MLYAVVSDMHGNLPAFTAVYEDAIKNGAEKFLLLGDYCEDYHTPNEITSFIRKLDTEAKAIVVRGNKEDYLTDIDKKDLSKLTDKQFAPIYWNYRELTRENLDYLIALPKLIEFIDKDSNLEFHMTHSMSEFTRAPQTDWLSSSGFFKRMQERPFTREEYLETINNLLQNDDALFEGITKLPRGVYIFGHSHLQWHANIDGRVFINPGSCGFQADFTSSVPYTILDTSADGIKITEHRVKYDNADTVEQLKNSELYKTSPIWFDLMILTLLHGEESVYFFLQVVNKVACEHGELTRPVSNEVWDKAEKIWRSEF